jgi:hypothetical protein
MPEITSEQLLTPQNDREVSSGDLFGQEDPNQVSSRSKAAFDLSTEYNIPFHQADSLVAGPEPSVFGKQINKVKQYLNENLGWFEPPIYSGPQYREEHMLKTAIGAAGYETSGLISGLTGTAADIVTNKITGDKSLADLVARSTGFTPTPQETDIKSGIENTAVFIPAGEVVGVGGKILTKVLPEAMTTFRGSKILGTMLNSGLTFTSTDAAIQFSQNIIDKKPVDWGNVVISGGIGSLFGSGEYAVNSVMTGFSKGIEKYWGEKGVELARQIQPVGQSLEDQVKRQNDEIVADVARARQSFRDTGKIPDDLMQKYVYDKLQEGSSLVIPKEVESKGNLTPETKIDQFTGEPTVNISKAVLDQDLQQQMIDASREYLESDLNPSRIDLEPSKLEISPNVQKEAQEALNTSIEAQEPDWSIGQERPFEFDTNSTKNEGRFRLYPPDELTDYFRRKSGTDGVSYVIGKDSEGNQVTQAIRFDKSKFTEDQASKWFEDNKDKFQFYKGNVNEKVGQKEAERQVSDIETGAESTTAPVSTTKENVTIPKKRTYSIKNADIDADREKMGKSPSMSIERQSNQATWDNAMKIMDENPGIQDRLINELNKTPRATTPEENVMLNHRNIELNTERDKLNDLENEAIKSDNKQALVDIQFKKAEFSDRYDRFDAARKAATSQTGRSLQSVQMMMKDDFSLAPMEQRQFIAKGKPLTEEERALIKTQHDKIQELQKALEKRQEKTKKIPPIKTELKLPKPLGEKTSDLSKPTFGSKNKLFTKQRADAAALEIKNILSRASSGIDPALLVKLTEVGGYYFEGGIREVGAWSKAMIDQFGEKIRPNLEDMWKDVNDIFETASQQRRLKSAKTRWSNRAEELATKISNEDFSKKAKLPELQLDKEAERIKANLERVKQEYEKKNKQFEFSNRTKLQKTLDLLVGLRRLEVLSGFRTLGKLLGYTITKNIEIAATEAIGGVYSNLPYYEKLFSQAPSEGGLNIEALVHSYQQEWTEGLKDSYKVATGSQPDYKIINDERLRTDLPRQWYEIAGVLHEAEKSPLRRQSYTLSLEKRMAFATKNGVDISDPLVMSAMQIDAYRDSNRALLYEENKLNNIINNAIKQLEAVNPETGKATLGGKVAATTVKLDLPVKKVAFNFVKQTYENAFGLITGNVKLAIAMSKGLDTLPPEQKDIIARQLKKGTISAGINLYAFYDGYFHDDKHRVFGGYYEPGKRSKQDVKFQSIRIGGVSVPSILLHSPMLESAQLFSTVGRIAREVKTKESSLSDGLFTGAIAGSLGLLGQSPIINEAQIIGELNNKYTRDNAIARYVKGFTDPMLLQDIAMFTDRDSQGNLIQRKPKGIKQAIESGLPLLRQNVPTNRSNEKYAF